MIQEQIIHRKQNRKGDSALACISMLFGIDGKMAKRAYKQFSKTLTVKSIDLSIRRTGLKVNNIYLNRGFLNIKDNLKMLSLHFPLLAICEHDTSVYEYGKENEEDIKAHSIVISDGIIYDPSQDIPYDVDCYEQIYDKSLKVRRILLIDEERPDYGKKNFIQENYHE